MTGLNRAAAVLLLVFALAASVSATTVPDSRGAWSKVAVPVELRGRVHMNAREVPGFPDEDPKLVHLKSWPEKREIGGWDCVLMVDSAYIDSRTPLRPGFNPITSTRYQCRLRWWPWGKPQMLGPSYTWTADGRILNRAYRRSRKDILVYELDRAGRLAGFEDRKHGTTEYFDADGVLIAGEYAPINLDWRSEGYRGGTVSVWLGNRVTHEEFVRRRALLFRDMAGRY